MDKETPDKSIDDKENLNLYVTAIHEAGHFVVAILGHKYEEDIINYIDKPEDEIPTKISIEGSDTYSGRVEVPCSIEIEYIEEVSNRRQSWHILKLLAGYAAETSYGLSHEYDTLEKVENIFNESRGQLGGAGDFNKVSRILYDLLNITDINFDDKFFNTAMLFWKAALYTVGTPIVQKAIKGLGKSLMLERSLSETEIMVLKNNNLNVAGIDDYLIQLPTLQL